VTELKNLIGQMLDVKIEKLAVGGSGIARHRFMDRDIVIFVPSTAPEDFIHIKIISTEKTFLIGQIVKILQPSRHRRHPPCAVAESCGGCSWQHIIESEQIGQKELILTDLFNKFLKDFTFELRPSVIGKKQFNYRNRIQLKHLGTSLGYFKKDSHVIVDIEGCPIADEKINEFIPKLKAKLTSDKRKTDQVEKYELKINSDDNFEYYPIGESGKGLSFAQVNSEINGLLVETTVSEVKKRNPTQITELFAGAGNFSFPIIQALPNANLKAVELSPTLTRNAVEKIKNLKLQKKLSFFTANCIQYCKSMSLSKELVVIDPPRSGCDRAILEKIATTKTKTLVYISCHPVNLVRDLAYLQKMGYLFEIKYLQIFDMFPQTDHFETLCIIENK
jgi:23S rRNA (uracil1939-C5)-methyltransferase